jgi:hypothetical protein
MGFLSNNKKIISMPKTPPAGHNKPENKSKTIKKNYIIMGKGIRSLFRKNPNDDGPTAWSKFSHIGKLTFKTIFTRNPKESFQNFWENLKK